MRCALLLVWVAACTSGDGTVADAGTDAGPCGPASASYPCVEGCYDGLSPALSCGADGLWHCAHGIPESYCNCLLPAEDLGVRDAGCLRTGYDASARPDCPAATAPNSACFPAACTTEIGPPPSCTGGTWACPDGYTLHPIPGCLYWAVPPTPVDAGHVDSGRDLG